MPALATIVGASTAAAWAYLVLARGWFWRLPTETLPAPKAGSDSARVVAIVPARDEADVVGPVVTSLLQQSIEMPVFLVDDASHDRTAEVARRAAFDMGKPGALTVLTVPSVPRGWTGKLWAMHQGIQRARELNPEWLLLADADVVQGPDTVASLATIAQDGACDLASFMVKLHCRSLAEKLLIPAFVFFFLKLYPPAWIRDNRHATAGAAGGCLLVRASTLEAAGGVAAIRGELIDDCSLARLIKQHGGRLWLGLTEHSFSLREYDTFTAIERMVSRTAFKQLNHSALLLAGTILGMLLTYLAPCALLAANRTALLLGAAAWTAMTLTYLPMVRYYRLHPAWALTLPLAALFYLGATLHSAMKYWMGRGGDWKGRIQDLEVTHSSPAGQPH